MLTHLRLLVLASALVAAPAAAQGFEDLDQLEQRLVAALGAGIGEPNGPARPIDRRLKLAACPEPAGFDAPQMGAVAIRCEPLGWRIRVPVARSLAVQVAAAKAEPIIRKGDQVEIEARGGAFTVSTAVVAEQDGAVGDRIRVRAPGSKAGAIIAQVTAEGRVALAGFK